MKTNVLTLAPVAVLLGASLHAGTDALSFAPSKIEAPSLFLSNPSTPPRKSEFDAAFSFSSGPKSLLQASPLVPSPVTLAAIEKIVLPQSRSFQSSPDRMPVLKPNPSVDYQLTVKDPGFHQDDGIIDGRPDLRPGKK